MQSQYNNFFPSLNKKYGPFGSTTTAQLWNLLQELERAFEESENEDELKSWIGKIESSHALIPDIIKWYRKENSENLVDPDSLDKDIREKIQIMLKIAVKKYRGGNKTKRNKKSKRKHTKTIVRRRR